MAKHPADSGSTRGRMDIVKYRHQTREWAGADAKGPGEAARIACVRSVVSIPVTDGSGMNENTLQHTGEQCTVAIVCAGRID